MPQYPSLFNQPPAQREPTEDEYLRYLRQADEERANAPLWKKLLEGLMGGMLGEEPNSDRKDAGDWTNLAVQGAGLPFAAYKALLPKGKLFHGTQQLFDKFDEAKNANTASKNLLPWFHHFAEKPEEASNYAMGYRGNPLGKRPRVIIAEPEAKNVLDLIDPNSEDLSEILGALDSQTRESLIKEFKTIQRKPNALEYEKSHRVLDGRDENNIPFHLLAKRLTENLDPELLGNTTFDAIRYPWREHNYWAVPQTTPIRSSYGNELLNDPINSSYRFFEGYPDKPPRLKRR